MHSIIHPQGKPLPDREITMEVRNRLRTSTGGVLVIRNQPELLRAGKLLDASLFPGSCGTIFECPRKNKPDRPATTRILRARIGSIMLVHPPIKIGRDPGIERLVRTLENIEVIHDFKADENNARLKT